MLVHDVGCHTDMAAKDMIEGEKDAFEHTLTDWGERFCFEDRVLQSLLVPLFWQRRLGRRGPAAR